jgi:hypothetical protein
MNGDGNRDAGRLTRPGGKDPDRCAGRVSDQPTNVFVQWKGTNVCLDLHCVCGYHGHLDGDFAYYLRCGECGRVYRMPTTFEPVEMLGDKDWGATQEPFAGIVHPDPVHGMDVVTISEGETP